MKIEIHLPEEKLDVDGLTPYHLYVDGRIFMEFPELQDAFDYCNDNYSALSFRKSGLVYFGVPALPTSFISKLQAVNFAVDHSNENHNRIIYITENDFVTLKYQVNDFSYQYIYHKVIMIVVNGVITYPKSNKLEV